jgi:hypothetical protein
MRSFSWMSCWRSRCGRLASSSSGVGTCTILHTRRSPVSQAMSTRVQRHQELTPHFVVSPDTRGSYLRHRAGPSWPAARVGSPGC